MKDQASPINGLLPQLLNLIPGDKVLCQQTVESKTLVHMLLTMMGNGGEEELIPQQEQSLDSATKLGKKRDRSRTRDKEEVTGVKDREWHHLVK